MPKGLSDVLDIGGLVNDIWGWEASCVYQIRGGKGIGVGCSIMCWWCWLAGARSVNGWHGFCITHRENIKCYDIFCSIAPAPFILTWDFTSGSLIAWTLTSFVDIVFLASRVFARKFFWLSCFYIFGSSYFSKIASFVQEKAVWRNRCFDFDELFFVLDISWSF